MREGDAVFPLAGPVTEASPAIHVNGEPHHWRPALSLADLLRQRAADERLVATAVNGRFVQRAQRPGTILAPGDAVLVFGAIVGG